MKKCIFTICLIMIAGFLCAQVIERKVKIEMGQSKHLYADLIMQKKFPVRAMIESGIPVLVLDSTFVFTHLEDLNISLAESDDILNLAGKKFRITHTTNDTIFINNLFYKGKAIITNLASKKIDVMYPIHMFRNPDDANSRIVELDISDQHLMPLTREEMNMKKKKYKKYPMRNDGYGNMYAIDTELTIISSSNEENYSLEGDYLLDLGNASFLFLLDQHPACKEFLANSNLKLQQGRDSKGRKLLVKAFWAEKCYIANKPFIKQTIAITKMLPKFTTVGVLGLKFFKRFKIIFDFDEKMLYLR